MKRLLFSFLGCSMFLISCAATTETETVTEDNVRIVRLTQPPRPAKEVSRPLTHRVKKNENLFNIARKYQLDYRNLAEWNNIEGNYVISPGQELVLHPKNSEHSSATAPAVAAPAAAQPARTWPVKGTPRYTKSGDGKGLLFQTGTSGEILAALDGSVAYVGDELAEYGMMILLSHADGVLTAYAQNVQPLVREGQTVKAGTKIATASANNKGIRVFYFEVRKSGKVVSATTILPKS